tara:strand:- start:5310 stop:6992 length:1683 start_codon:yes stop_codon:yes gene_type:complete
MRIVFFILLITSNIILSQNKSENGDVMPLDIAINLSGTYGELRSNHFHSGIDIKTKGVEGLNVYSYDNGHVSRVKISHGGYGKALYILHPDGTSSVYAHLKKFSPKIEKIVKSKQYKKKSYEIEFFPKESEIKILKNEIIAFSGNTGGTTGPHLHFELRDSNQIPVNPLLNSHISIKDNTPPFVSELFYKKKSYDIQSQHKIKKISNTTYLADTIKDVGKIGFGIIAFDKHDLANNKNGVSKISTYLNGNNILSISFDSISFNETKHINTFIDYAFFKNNRKRIQKLYIEDYNPLKFYKTKLNNGYISVNHGESYIYEIHLTDANRNTSILTVPITGDSLANNLDFNLNKKLNKFNLIETKKEYEFDFIDAKVSIPKGTFYKDISLDISFKNDILSIDKDTIPLLKPITISFNIDRYNDSIKDRLFVGKLSENNKIVNYSYTIDVLNSKKSSTKSLGNYMIGLDTISPSISPIGFKQNDWISNSTTLKIQIKDNESGIRKYNGWINDKWILFELNTKKGVLVYDFDDNVIKEAKNNLYIEVIDNVGNISQYKTVFYRKSN